MTFYSAIVEYGGETPHGSGVGAVPTDPLKSRDAVPCAMSVTTVCQICEAATASHTCNACGAAVCAEHYDRGMGMCASCAARARGGDG